jgi:hypothetical protein
MNDDMTDEWCDDTDDSQVDAPSPHERYSQFWQHKEIETRQTACSETAETATTSTTSAGQERGCVCASVKKMFPHMSPHVWGAHTVGVGFGLIIMFVALMLLLCAFNFECERARCRFVSLRTFGDETLDETEFRLEAEHCHPSNTWMRLSDLGTAVDENHNATAACFKARSFFGCHTRLHCSTLDDDAAMYLGLSVPFFIGVAIWTVFCHKWLSEMRKLDRLSMSWQDAL